VDSTGIKVSNRGEWIKEKWNGSKRKGFIKFHIAIDTRTGKILSIDVTRENVSDGAKAIPLIESASKRVDNISKSLMDGAYDRRSIFNYLSKNNIEPVIRVRKNSSSKARGSIARKLAVIEQLSDYDRWRKNHGYGDRWRVESSISSFKRMFGEYVTSTKWKYMVNEMFAKARLYNMFLAIKAY
jgi:Transposase DDE domain.